MADNPYKRAIPKAYHKQAGLDRFDARVVQFRGSCTRLYADHCPAREIEESAYCRVRISDRIADVLVPKTESGPLFAGVVHISLALITGVRLHRFTEAFKAYESLSSAPEMQLAAMRHAISHPETVLSRPKTVAALEALFGGLKIDLERADHRRVFYREFGRLLMAVDGLIGAAIDSRDYRWHQVPRGYHPEVAAYAGWFPSSAG